MDDAKTPLTTMAFLSPDFHELSHNLRKDCALHMLTAVNPIRLDLQRTMLFGSQRICLHTQRTLRDPLFFLSATLDAKIGAPRTIHTKMCSSDTVNWDASL
mmetsp:Transcript_11159/g.41699  ORF Transcript_11159/g.41699 Transcript_11159/m.41699 type:complete len:101 (+) Transcript_11159:889-1191(+)